MKKGQIRMNDGSEFTVFYLKNKDGLSVKNPLDVPPPTIESNKNTNMGDGSDDSTLLKWFWGN